MTTVAATGIPEVWWLPPSHHLSPSVGWQLIDLTLVFHLVCWSGTLPLHNPKLYPERWNNKTDHKSATGRLPGCRAPKALQPRRQAAEGCRIKDLPVSAQTYPTPPPRLPASPPPRHPSYRPVGTKGLFYISSLHPASPLDITHTRLRKRGCMGRYNGGPANVLPVIVSVYSGGAMCLCMCANMCAQRGFECRLGNVAFM